MPIKGVIQSRIHSVGELLTSGAFAAAKAQREYCWGEDQQSALMDDLLGAFAEFGFDPDASETPENYLSDASAEAEPRAIPKEASADRPFALPQSDDAIEQSAPAFFLGTMVLMPSSEAQLIFDGLQRITTLMVIFAVIRDKLPDAAENARLAPLLQTGKNAFRLHLPMRHDTLISDVLTPGRTKRAYGPLAGITHAGLRLRECVAIVRERLNGWSRERLIAFAHFVRDVVAVSVITIEDRRLAGKAFISINASGLRLKPEEILKGQLIELAAQTDDVAAAETQILSSWRALQDDLGAKFGDFIKAVDFIERRKPQAADHAIQLIEHVRRAYPGHLAYQWATGRLFEYRDAFLWLDEAGDAPVAAGVHASLRRLSLLNWDQWKALAMLVKFKTQRKSDLARRISIVDRACFALTLQRLDPRRRSAVIARAVDRFAEFGRFGAQGGFVFNRLAHEKMRRGLEGPALDGPTRNVMLRWIEAARHGDRVPYYVCRASGATVEHVYPKNPQDKWPQFDGTFEESVTLQEQMGNLCILPEDRLDNADFETKRRAYARARGYLFANEIAKHREWNPNVLRGRTIELADQTMRFLNFEIAQS